MQSYKKILKMPVSLYKKVAEWFFFAALHIKSRAFFVTLHLISTHEGDNRNKEQEEQ